MLHLLPQVSNAAVRSLNGSTKSENTEPIQIIPEPTSNQPNPLQLHPHTKVGWYLRTQIQLLQHTSNHLLLTLDGWMFVIAANITIKLFWYLYTQALRRVLCQGGFSRRLCLKLYDLSQWFQNQKIKTGIRHA